MALATSATVLRMYRSFDAGTNIDLDAYTSITSATRVMKPTRPGVRVYVFHADRVPRSPTPYALHRTRITYTGKASVVRDFVISAMLDGRLSPESGLMGVELALPSQHRSWTVRLYTTVDRAIAVRQFIYDSLMATRGVEVNGSIEEKDCEDVIADPSSPLAKLLTAWKRAHARSSLAQEADEQVLKVKEKMLAQLLLSGEMDLHGLQVCEAKTLVPIMIDTVRGRHTHILLITGRGNHNQDGSCPLRDAVTHTLIDNHCLQWGLRSHGGAIYIRVPTSVRTTTPPESPSVIDARAARW